MVQSTASPPGAGAGGGGGGTVVVVVVTTAVVGVGVSDVDVLAAVDAVGWSVVVSVVVVVELVGAADLVELLPHPVRVRAATATNAAAANVLR